MGELEFISVVTNWGGTEGGWGPSRQKMYLNNWVSILINGNICIAPEATLIIEFSASLTMQNWDTE